MKVKSFITSHKRGQALQTGTHQIGGVTWSGEGEVSKLEVSTDNGQTWELASLQESESPYSWRQWTYDWNADKAGYFLIRSRATDAAGNVQPEQFDWNFRGFANNSIHVVPVTVRAK